MGRKQNAGGTAAAIYGSQTMGALSDPAMATTVANPSLRATYGEELLAVSAKSHWASSSDSSTRSPDSASNTRNSCQKRISFHTHGVV